MNSNSKVVVEVECSIPNDLFVKVSALGKEISTEKDFFDIGVAYILKESFDEAKLEETVSVEN